MYFCIRKISFQFLKNLFIYYKNIYTKGESWRLEVSLAIVLYNRGGEEEVRNTRANLGWKHEAFNIPKEIYSEWDASDQGQATEDEWNKRQQKDMFYQKKQKEQK